MKPGRIISVIGRIAVPTAIFLVVWYITGNVQRYTLLMQEQKGIFLNTPDYYRQLFSDPWPVTTLISDFLVQFYRVANLGAIITGAIVTLVYLMASIILRFVPMRRLAGGIAAAATWIATAHANTPHTGVVILCFTALACLVSAFLPYKKTDKAEKFSWIGDVAAIALIFGAAFMIISNKQIRSDEKWYAVEYTTRCHDWDIVLAIATPQICKSDMSYVPYALLALNAKGQLGEKLYNYPVTGVECLGENGDDSWSAFSLRSMIYETIGCPNEAIHQAFQLGMRLPHGTSFGILRQLIRLEMEKGDYALALKHAEVLGRSPYNRKVAESAKNMAERMMAESAVADDPGRDTDTMISNNAVYNMSGIILNCKDANQAARDRLLCHLLLSNDINGLRQALSDFYGNAEPEKIPTAFRKAIGK